MIRLYRYNEKVTKKENFDSIKTPPFNNSPPLRDILSYQVEKPVPDSVYSDNVINA